MAPLESSYLLEILTVLGQVRTMHSKLIAFHVNDLGAGDVFTPAVTAPCRLLFGEPFFKAGNLVKY